MNLRKLEIKDTGEYLDPPTGVVNSNLFREDSTESEFSEKLDNSDELKLEEEQKRSDEEDFLTADFRGSFVPCQATIICCWFQ